MSTHIAVTCSTYRQWFHDEFCLDVGISPLFSQVLPGAGGLEASLFAQEVFDMYCAYADSIGYSVDVAEYVSAHVGAAKGSRFTSTTGIQRATALVRGEGVFGQLR